MENNIKFKEFNSMEEIAGYYIAGANLYDFTFFEREGNIKFNFDFRTKSSLNAKKIIGLNITANKINADSIEAVDIESNLISTNELRCITINCKSINAIKLYASKVTAEEVNACTVNVMDFKAFKASIGEIYSHKIKCKNLTVRSFLKANEVICEDLNAFCKNIEINDVKTDKLDCENIEASNIISRIIKAKNITAHKIKSETLFYDSFCIAFETFQVFKISGIRKNHIHKCLDSEIIFKEFKENTKVFI